MFFSISLIVSLGFGIDHDLLVFEKTCFFLSTFLFLSSSFLWWNNKFVEEVKNNIGHQDNSVGKHYFQTKGWQECYFVGTDKKNSYHYNEEIVRNICVQGASCNKFIPSFIEHLVSKGMHAPSSGIDPHPGATGVEALDGEVTVEWVEEQEAGLSVVVRGAQRVYQNEGKNHEWSPHSLGHVLSGSHHLLEVKLVDKSLGEEDGIVVNHHQYVMERSIWSLVFPQVECN